MTTRTARPPRFLATVAFKVAATAARLTFRASPPRSLRSRSPSSPPLARRATSCGAWLVPLVLVTVCAGCGGKTDSTPSGAPKPGTPAVQPTSQTASLSPETTYHRLAVALAEHRPEAFYDLLPSRYQEELDATLRAIAEDADEELWNQGLASLRKALRVLREKPDLVLSHPLIEEGTYLRREHLEKNWDAFVGLFAAALDGDSLELSRLREGRVGRGLMSGPTASFLKSFAEISKTTEGDPYGAFAGRLRGQRVTVRSQKDDEARLLIATDGEPPREETWRRVDGRWLPESVVLSWTQRLGTLRKSFGVGVFRKGTSPEWRTAALERFRSIDERLDELLAAEEPEDFHAQFTETVLAPFLGFASAVRGTVDEPAEPGGLDTAAADGRNSPDGAKSGDVKPGGDSAPRAAKRPAVTTSATVLVKGKLDAAAREVWQYRLGNVSDAPDFAICVPTIDSEGTLFEVNPVGDVEAFAKRMKFTTVESVDAARRRVTVRADFRPN